MKPLRIILLVLLALLVPVRGAVAMALLCPPASHGGSSSQATDHHAHDGSGPAHHTADSGASHHGGSGSVSPTPTGSCHLCAAYCSMTPLLSEMPTLQQPVETSTVSFPVLSAPPPTFESGGQERPPRRS